MDPNARQQTQAEIEEEYTKKRRIREATKREWSKRKIQDQYADLPPLPREVPAPEYFVQGVPTYKKDNASRRFYSACAHGKTGKIRSFIESSRPTYADLEYALEQASHSFQVDVVRYLMGEHNIQVHTRVFQRRIPTRIIPLEDRPPPSSQNIFTSDNPELLQLLKAFIDHGWHPNQMLRPLQDDISLLLPLQEVSMHYSRCLQDKTILKLLLECGADPTIARDKWPIAGFQLYSAQAPVRRRAGHILEMAVTVGTPDTINLLLSHGAKLQYGAPLHSLVQRSPPEDSPNSARFRMGSYLLHLGEDINGLKNVFRMVRDNSGHPLPGYYEATPLSHAVGSRDWAFVEWLLENGADPQADHRRFNRDEFVYSFEKPGIHHHRLQELIQKVEHKKAASR